MTKKITLASISKQIEKGFASVEARMEKNFAAVADDFADIKGDIADVRGDSTEIKAAMATKSDIANFEKGQEKMR